MDNWSHFSPSLASVNSKAKDKMISYVKFFHAKHILFHLFSFSSIPQIAIFVSYYDEKFIKRSNIFYFIYFHFLEVINVNINFD